MRSAIATVLTVLVATLSFTSVSVSKQQSEIGTEVQENPAPLARFDPDREKDAVNYFELADLLGPIPKPKKRYRIGVVVKFLGNQYWQLLAKGMESKANDLGLIIDLRAGATESDPKGQLAMMEEMINKDYDALLISPQTDNNLIPAVEKARQKKILLINVDDAVLEDAEQFIGPNQYENGIRAARYFIEKYPRGGKVAVIKGLAGVYAVRQRSQGFVDTLQGRAFELVAQVHGDWDLQKSLEHARNILEHHPDVTGFYCNNDIMALGVTQAVKTAGLSEKIIVIGTDGIMPAYDSIRAGEMTGTVDSFPYETGLVAVEVALRILEGQKVPRVVFSPQNLVTSENADNPFPGDLKGTK